MAYKKFNNYKLLKDYAIMQVKFKENILDILIDLEDINKVIKIGSWHAIKDKHGFYICHRFANKKDGVGCIKLHRFIMNCPINMQIDHINHNTLDNRKQNLKICTQFENHQNKTNNKSGVVGVYKNNRGYWVAKIDKNNKSYRKQFKTKEQAIAYRKEMEEKLYANIYNNNISRKGKQNIWF